jgi:thiamine biosynthesis lipoprotein ApbE
MARTSPALLALLNIERATALTSAAPAPGGAATPRVDSAGEFTFAYDGVLGTSLDARLVSPTARDAREAGRRLLAEIDRLEKILSPRDPASEFSRVRAGAAIESAELADVLVAYERWSARTHGALHPNLAGVTALWHDAARTGHEPDRDALAAAFAAPGALAIDALGKAYIIDRATAVAREFSSAGLLNIGGDLRAWGERSWMIDVANPFDPADNAPPLARIPLRNAAVATSGGYARNFTVGARRYSHLIDPRTLRPIAPDRAATVVAPDCVSANALSTALCVLDAGEATPIARAFASDFLRVGGLADLGASRGFGPVAASTPAKFAADVGAIPSAAGGTWPEEFRLSVGLSLKAAESQGRRVKRPYVAVWVEDAEHHLVRTLTVWGREGRYLPDLTKWWRAVGGNPRSAAAVTRATRSPGDYTVAWDGRNDQGERVPQGDYTIVVEINREHGHHVWESATVACGGAAATAELRDTAESDPSTITYGPRSG